MRLDTAVVMPNSTSPLPESRNCGTASIGIIQPPSTSPDFSAFTRAVASFMKSMSTVAACASSDSSQ